VFAALDQFERELVIERSVAGVAAARAGTDPAEWVVDRPPLVRAQPVTER
jgi:DNA invertase Pin-like site-specific DNA recombinase